MPRVKGYVVQPIGDRIYWLSDGAYSSMFVVTADGVTACNAPPTIGANYRYVGTIEPLWNIFDLTSEGRGTDWEEQLSYS